MKPTKCKECGSKKFYAVEPYRCFDCGFNNSNPQPMNYPSLEICPNCRRKSHTGMCSSDCTPKVCEKMDLGKNALNEHDTICGIELPCPHHTKEELSKEEKLFEFIELNWNPVHKHTKDCERYCSIRKQTKELIIETCKGRYDKGIVDALLEIIKKPK